MKDKSKCVDMFVKLQLDGNHVYDQQPQIDLIEFKSKKLKLEKIINKIKFIKGFNILKGEMYNFLLLRLIEVQKELFVLDVEQGNEIFIPKSLSLDQYPKSFQFYDPLQHIIWENISKHKKQKF